MLGAVAAPRLQGRLRLGTAATVITLAGALLLGIAAALIPSPLVALPVAIDLLLAPTVNAALFAVMLRRTPEEMRGRVSNSVVMVATALATLAPLTAGLLVHARLRRLGHRRLRRHDGGGGRPQPATARPAPARAPRSCAPLNRIDQIPGPACSR